MANGIVGLESFFCRAGATRIDVCRLGEDRAGAMRARETTEVEGATGE